MDEILNKIANRSYFTSEATAIDAEIKRLKETNINSSFSKGVFEKKDIVKFREVKTTKSLEDAKSQGLLNDDQCETIKSYILRLTKCCDDKGISSIFQGANENASPGRVMLNFDSTEADPETSQLADCFVKRLEQMTAYIEKVSKEIDSGGTAFGEKYWIRSTGSDPHKEGEHALFFVNKINQEGYEADPRKRAGEVACVYKAHDLKPDAAVVGKEGMFARVNEIVRNDFIIKATRLGLVLEESPENAFATMQINAEKHTEELVAKKKEMTAEEAKLYFFRGGILKALTDAMAVIDLHGDNIMPTEKGPMIIDAEIDFFQEQDSGLMKHALKTDHHDRDETGPRTNSSFDIIGVGKSGEVFKDEASPFRILFNQGYAFMLDQMRSDGGFFAGLYEAQLQNISKIRILPIATPDFAQYLHGAILTPKTEEFSYVDKANRKQRYNRQHDASWVTDQIEERLKNPANRFIFDDVLLDKNELTRTIKTTFDNGTIIAVYVNMNDGQIFLDNTPIGRILRGGHVLIKADIIGIMRDRFLNTVRTLPGTPA